MKKITFLLFAIVALYFISFHKPLSPNREYLDDGLIKTTIPMENITMELYNSNNHVEKFLLIYHIKNSSPTWIERQQIKKEQHYDRFLRLAHNLSGISTQTLNEQVVKLFHDAEYSDPPQVVCNSKPEYDGPWYISWRLSQVVHNSEDDDNTIPNYISIKGILHDHPAVNL